MLVNQPKKWTLNGVISVGVFATLNGVTLRISNPKWRIGQNSTLGPKCCINQYFVQMMLCYGGYQLQAYREN